MIKEHLKGGNIMNNVSNKDIIYLNYSNSTTADQYNENSSMPDSLANVLKSGTTVIIDDLTNPFLESNLLQ